MNVFFLIPGVNGASWIHLHLMWSWKRAGCPCARAREQLSDADADAGRGNAPWHRAVSAPLLPVRTMRRLSLRILSGISLCKPGSVPWACPPTPPVTELSPVRFLHDYRSQRCGERPVRRRLSSSLGRSTAVDRVRPWRSRGNLEVLGADEGRVAHRTKSDVRKRPAVRSRKLGV